MSVKERNGKSRGGIKREGLVEERNRREGKNAFSVQNCVRIGTRIIVHPSISNVIKIGLVGFIINAHPVIENARARIAPASYQFINQLLFLSL
jgi:hypothetical protein